MKWIKNRLTPNDCEPIYEIIEVETGREISNNIEEDEADIICNSKQMYNILLESVEYLEDLYLSTKITNQNQLDCINNHITDVYKILDKIRKK